MGGAISDGSREVDKPCGAAVFTDSNVETKGGQSSRTGCCELARCRTSLLFFSSCKHNFTCIYVVLMCCFRLPNGWKSMVQLINK